MRLHEQFADDLALLARGRLQGEERVALEKHLEGCAACRHELERLRGAGTGIGNAYDADCDDGSGRINHVGTAALELSAEQSSADSGELMLSNLLQSNPRSSCARLDRPGILPELDA